MVLEKWTFHILKYYIANWGGKRRLLYVVGTNTVVFTWLILCSTQTKLTDCWRGMKQENKQHELMPGEYQKSPSESVTENIYL